MTSSESPLNYSTLYSSWCGENPTTLCDVCVALVAMSPMITAFVLFFLWFHISFRNMQKLARKKGEVTETPVVPKWLQEDALIHSVVMRRGVRLESRWKKVLNEPWLGASSVYAQLQEHLNKKFGEAMIHVPLDICLVTIPFEGFKCTQVSCIDFEPDSEDVEPDGYFLYQMCGDNKIQISYYVSSDKVHVAGYCLYAESIDLLWSTLDFTHVEHFVLPEVKREQEKKEVSSKRVFVCSHIIIVYEHLLNHAEPRVCLEPPTSSALSLLLHGAHFCSKRGYGSFVNHAELIDIWSVPITLITLAVQRLYYKLSNSK